MGDMAMLNQIFLGQGRKVGPLYDLYREMVRCGKAAANLSYTASQTYTLPDNVVLANTLTIGAGAVVKLPNTLEPAIIACDSLVINGTLLAGSPAAGGSGTGASGGAGAGAIFIFARSISGGGWIKANGAYGGNGVVTSVGSGASGGSSYFLSTTKAGGGGGATGTNTPGVGGNKCLPLYSTLGFRFPHWLGKMDMDLLISGGGGGGGAGTGTNNGNIYAPGGGGGGSVVADGGRGGEGNSSQFSAAGAGGGGAGLIMVLSENAVPALTLEARGGNGGNAYDSYAGGGGGGGGGVISVIAPTSYASAHVTGGNAGSGYNSNFVSPVAGGPGTVLLTRLTLS
ncbi:hypothetical protein BCM02_12330 [Paenibacillus methanolicus]|uniref:Uncharacterized protein n=1 Tax=Paenibacillus methanolicus TaxID=582686 RepID=A0A5S5BKY2_9BACL|nr:hypothetical protein BCM02_12330 [Paenibacillus methanolicus]